MHVRASLKYAALFIVIQIVIWLVVSMLDLVEVFIFVYYPTVRLVEKLGNFTGSANIIIPIVIGVPLGVVAYSIILAAILTTLKRRRFEKPSTKATS